MLSIPLYSDLLHYWNDKVFGFICVLSGTSNLFIPTFCLKLELCVPVKSWPNDYTFLSTFAIHLYCKSRAMYCVVAKRVDISLYNLFAFTEDFSPSQQQPVKQHKRAQIFMIKWSAIEENNCT